MSKKYEIDFTSAFSKDLKKIKKRGYNIDLLESVVDKLQTGEQLEPKYKDHFLTGNWKGYKECHIQPDWLLIYRICDDKLLLVLTRTGTHSDLRLT